MHIVQCMNLMLNCHNDMWREGDHPDIQRMFEMGESRSILYLEHAGLGEREISFEDFDN